MVFHKRPHDVTAGYICLGRSESPVDHPHLIRKHAMQTYLAESLLLCWVLCVCATLVQGRPIQASELQQSRVNDPKSLPPMYCAFSATEAERRLGCSKDGERDADHDKLPVVAADPVQPSVLDTPAVVIRCGSSREKQRHLRESHIDTHAAF